MAYREILPDPRLAPFVRCFWYLVRDYSAPGAHEVVWPDGKTELLLLSAAPYGMKARGVKFLEEPKAMPWGTFVQFEDPDGHRYVLKG